MTPQQGSRAARPQRTLLLILALFVLPVLAVLAMLHYDYRPGGTSHGTLLAPPRALQFPATQDMRGHAFDARHWQDKWSLVQVQHGACAAECLEQARTLRQVHVALNKEIGRVQRVLLVPGADAALPTLQQDYPDLVILTGPGAAALARQMEASGTSAGVYLVDPLGNAIMAYASQHTARGMLKDMERLLKYSWIG